jgi:hypothetical protein
LEQALLCKASENNIANLGQYGAQAELGPKISVPKQELGNEGKAMESRQGIIAENPKPET